METLEAYPEINILTYLPDDFVPIQIEKALECFGVFYDIILVYFHIIMYVFHAIFIVQVTG